MNYQTCSATSSGGDENPENEIQKLVKRQNGVREDYLSTISVRNFPAHANLLSLAEVLTCPVEPLAL